MPFSDREPLEHAVPGSAIMPVEGADHSVTYAQAKVVSSLMLRALTSRDASAEP